MAAPEDRVTIDVLFSDSCAHVEETRREVERAVAEAGLSAEVRFTRVRSQREADERGFVGSPTVRVNGRDVMDAATGERPVLDLCRAYPLPDGSTAHYPPKALILEALESGPATSRPGGAPPEPPREPRFVSEPTGHAAPWDPRGPGPGTERR